MRLLDDDTAEEPQDQRGLPATELMRIIRAGHRHVNLSSFVPCDWAREDSIPLRGPYAQPASPMGALSPPPPNVLFLTCHDLGHHLGCYGQPSVDSPALDGLAAAGVRFARSFATAPQCSPSRASLHTGRYPHSAGMLGLAHHPFGWRLGPDEQHLAQRLRDRGYATALVGRQHLTAHERAAELGYGTTAPVRPAGEEAAAAGALLRQLGSGTSPFYLEVGFEEPHRPYDFGGAEPDTSRGVAVPGYLPDSQEARTDLAALQGAIRVMDSGVGRILHALAQLGLDETTWVVFATDHGVAMPRAKGTLYDPGIEAALIMRWPAGDIGVGRTCPELISNVDVVPTMLEGMGFGVPTEIQGRGAWPWLRGEPHQPRAEIFAEKTFHTYYEPMRCIRTDSHKLIANLEVSTAVDVPADVRSSPIYPLMLRQFGGVRPYLELYDLAADPWEQHNLVDEPLLAELRGELAGRLVSWMRATGDPILDGPVPSPYYADALARLVTSPTAPADEPAGS